MPSLLKLPTKPSDCLIGIALPMSEETLAKGLAKNEEGSFVVHLMELYGKTSGQEIWESGYGILVSKLKKMLTEVERAGVRVFYNFNIKHFEQITDRKILTLFAHWATDQDRIELADDLYLPETIARQIPLSYQGIFDLTVCYSTILQEAIKKEHPSCLVLGNEHRATLEFRIIFYKHLIRLLQKKTINYIDAFKELRLMLARK